MPRARIIARVLWPLLCFALSPAVIAAPRVPIEKALQAAQGDLKTRGLGGQVFITSVTLEPAGGASGERWVVRWSQAIQLDSTKRETGLEVAMDGSMTRLVTVAPGGAAPATAGERQALTNHRTRSDRPSILDLKH